MPIKRDRRPLYGPLKVWNAIARGVKDAANWMCQNCGATHGMPHPTNGKRTVMTVAHLDLRNKLRSDQPPVALCTVPPDL